MARRWGPVTGVMLAALLTMGIGLPSAAAKGEDVCDEPNDMSQNACYLGNGSEALGFISSADDVDGYRFETRDFGVHVRLELPDRPFPYRLSLVNYDGTVLNMTDDATISATLALPGSYYAFVESVTGEWDEGRPYRIAASMRYPGGDEPEVLYSQAYALDMVGNLISPEGVSQQRQYSDAVGTYSYGNGRFWMQLTAPGSIEQPSGTQFTIVPDPSDPVPTLEDFSLTIDSRMTDPADAGYSVQFRVLDSGNFYEILVKLESRQAVIAKLVDNRLILLSEWTPIPSLKLTGINRTVVRCVGDEIRASINGQPIGTVQDDSFKVGLIGYGAGTWGSPTTLIFDNILVTTPTRR